MTRLQTAAMLCSYAVEGVKDQREINKMVADSLLNNRSCYLELRHRMVGQVSAEDLRLMDEYHRMTD